MLNNLLMLIQYDIRLTMRNAFTWLTPLLFFIIVVCLFPIALGPENNLLAKIAPSIIWVTALLALLLSLGHLFQTDADEGYLDCMLLSPLPLTLLVFCKCLSHWITHGLPLIILSPLLGLILHISWDEGYVLFLTLLLGTPVLSLIGAVGSALTVGVRQQGLLLPILIMPLYIPVLIFGTGTNFAASAHLPIDGYLAIMAAFIFLSLAFAPLFASLALRLGVNQ